MKPIIFKHNLKTFQLTLATNFHILFKQKSMWLSLFLFALTLLILFPFALGSEMLKVYEVQMGSYWIIQEFVIALLVLNMFKIEEESNTIEIYASTRCSKLSFFYGKVIFTWLHILSLQIPIILLWIIIFNLEIHNFLKLWPTMALASTLFALTSSLLGGFLYCVTQKSHIREVIQPLLFFPLQSASLLAATSVCLISQNNQTMLEWSAWWSILIIYPVLFVGLLLVFGEMILEK